MAKRKTSSSSPSSSSKKKNQKTTTTTKKQRVKRVTKKERMENLEKSKEPVEIAAFRDAFVQVYGLSVKEFAEMPQGRCVKMMKQNLIQYTAAIGLFDYENNESDRAAIDSLLRTGHKFVEKGKQKSIMADYKVFDKMANATAAWAEDLLETTEFNEDGSFVVKKSPNTPAVFDPVLGVPLCHECGIPYPSGSGTMFNDAMCRLCKSIHQSRRDYD